METLVIFLVRFREMFRQAQHDTAHALSFRAKHGNLVETKRSACFPFLALSMWRSFCKFILYSCSLHVAERGGATAPERGLLPDYSQKLFNKDKGNYKTSILFSLNFAKLNSASFPASWGSQGVVYKLARKSPLLGESKTILFNSAVIQTALPPLLFLIGRNRRRLCILLAFLAQILLDSLLFNKLFVGGSNDFFARITHRIKR